ncbi:MAG: hypothetical protein LBJ12_09600 [Oscillospiraceae bacterium]|nr:hypothetical protein [Oscillospiraceae bacterium]
MLVKTDEGYVPYGAGANTAAEVNAGLEIINVLSAAFGWSVPVIIDGAESVTKLIDIAPQLIRMYVSEQDRQLRFVPDAA